MMKSKLILFAHSLLALTTIGCINGLSGEAIATTPHPELEPKLRTHKRLSVGKTVRYIARQNSRGQASWYGPGFHGRQTANGEQFNQNALTAAHPSLPFGTKVKVTNVNNGLSVVVRINDRGPFVRGRIIDLSAGAARIIDLVRSGVAPVRLEILGR